MTEYRRCLSLLPLINVAEVFEPVASTKGSSGYGEGFIFGKNSLGKSRHYFYRFAGKPIPRDQIAYLTSEDNYFSRQVGERQQVIVLWDEEHQGFRVLVDHTISTGFMAEYKRIVGEGAETAVIAIAHGMEQQAKVIASLKGVNMDDLF